MVIEMFVVVVCEQGEGNDGIPYVLGVFNTEVEAGTAMETDMRDYAADQTDYVIDYDNRTVRSPDGKKFCRWSIASC